MGFKEMYEHVESTQLTQDSSYEHSNQHTAP
jgi:hypothetical protein